MIEQVWDTPKVYRIPIALPDNPLRELNAYVIQGERRNVVIDTGFNRPECRKALWSGIEELNLDLSRTQLFLTHLHSDHIGLVWDFVEKGVPVYMGECEYQYFAMLYRWGGIASLDRRFQQEGYPIWELKRQAEDNQGRRYAPEPDFPATLLQDNDCLGETDDLEIRACLTPGHTPGHMCLYLPKEQLLFAGDHILFDITPNISVWEHIPHSLADYMDSLRRVQKMPIRAAFPAHRARQKDVSGRINTLLEHHQERLREIYQAVHENPGLTAYKLAGKITWSAHGKTWENFPPQQKWFAVGETLAHLDYLCDRNVLIPLKKYGYVTYKIDKSTELFQPASCG